MRKYFKYIALASISFFVVACGNPHASKQSEAEEVEVVENRVYGILSDDYNIDYSEIKSGETMGKILNSYGISAVDIDRLDKASKEIFPLNKIKGGNRYATFTKQDSISSKLDYLVYEEDDINYVVFAFNQVDSIPIYKGAKPTTIKRNMKSATIESSMWGAIMDANLPFALAAEIEDIYQWTVDFFAIQKGDNFTVIYDEKFVEDTISVGIGRVWGAKFGHGEQTYYAIPFIQNNTMQYWEENGASLRKQMLKAPLKYSRISSGFSYARLHPIYKTYRAHTGVDYAAPSGTPVHSVADGVVTFKGWGGGGGNTLKIKHPNNITTGYLHLRGYAKGISVGTHVKQGQLIGYVGSTGASTGPHLDYRVWKGGTPINPLKIPQEPQEPISDENKAAFDDIRRRIIGELEGTITSEEFVTHLDSVHVSSVDNIQEKSDGSEDN
ncbi:MAG: peptidoglycan DD-metalloendopeptidase family protein [Rikenellaceae bacterium]